MTPLVGQQWVDVAQLVAGASAAVQTVVVLAAAVYAFGQVRESRKSRSADIVLGLFERMHTPEASNRRRRLYTEIPDAWPDLTEDQDRDVQDVISDFYLIGYMVENKLLPFEAIVGLYSGSAVRCWTICEPYILRERARRGTPYAHYFESLYERCLKHLERRQPGVYPLIYRPQPLSTTPPASSSPTPAAPTTPAAPAASQDQP